MIFSVCFIVSFLKNKNVIPFLAQRIQMTRRQSVGRGLQLTPGIGSMVSAKSLSSPHPPNVKSVSLFSRCLCSRYVCFCHACVISVVAVVSAAAFFWWWRQNSSKHSHSRGATPYWWVCWSNSVSEWKRNILWLIKFLLLCC